jgi:hypothetical protein
MRDRTRSLKRESFLVSVLRGFELVRVYRSNCEGDGSSIGGSVSRATAENLRVGTLLDTWRDNCPLNLKTTRDDGLPILGNESTRMLSRKCGGGHDPRVEKKINNDR